MNCIDFPESQGILGRPPTMAADECSAAPIAVGRYAGKYPAVITCWQPTDEEREAIAAGANVYLHIIGPTMQPAMLSTKIEVELEGQT